MPLGRSASRGPTGLRTEEAPRRRVHRLFLGNGRPTQGLPDDARKLPRTVRSAHLALSLLARHSLSEYFAHEPCDRLHGWVLRSVHLRRSGGSLAHVAPRICSRGIPEIQDWLRKPGSPGTEESAKGFASAL